MRVFLVRHGEAADAGGARPLTAGGRADMERLASWCAANGVDPAEIRHSGILRAAESAEILAARLSPQDGVRPFPGLAPNDDAESWVAELAVEPRSLMLVTHMPFVAELAARLTDRRVAPSFATSQIEWLERGPERFRVTATWRPPGR